MDTADDMTMGRWEGRALLLVDLDAFFASVEQLDHPSWRGKPVIVGGSEQARGVVSTCSYEARAFGVRSAMPSAQARRLCPEAIWTGAHFERYREVSARVMDILLAESPLLERMSIDEAYLDVTPGHYLYESPIAIAQRIQQRVAQLGVTCSIGLASGKATAKIASELDKPCGLTVVFPGSEAAFLADMDVRALPGIGQRNAARLKGLGVYTLADLAACPLEQLTPIFGVNANDVRERARGNDTRDVQTQDETKSVSHERTFARDLTRRDELDAALDMLGALVGRRLRREGLAGCTVHVKLRYNDLTRRSAQRTLQSRVDDEHVFVPIAKQLLGGLWRPGDAVRLVGLGVSGFEEHDTQLELFAHDEDIPQGRPELMSAADTIRDRFGDDALAFGRELKLDVPTGGAAARGRHGR